MNTTHETTEQRLKQNLYNRLKPEFAKDLDAVATKYPNLYWSVKKVLRENSFYTDISYGDALELCTALNRNIQEVPLFFEDYTSEES